MKYLIFIFLLFLVSCNIKINKTKLKQGDCFEIPTVKSTIFKVRAVFKNSYFAGRYSGKSTGRKFYKNYPAMQITTVSFDQMIYKTDCRNSKGWKEAFDKSINIEFNDRKSKYNKDAVRPK